MKIEKCLIFLCQMIKFQNYLINERKNAQLLVCEACNVKKYFWDQLFRKV